MREGRSDANDDRLHGELLREALASLILSGSLFPGVGEQLTRAIDAWTLHCALTPDVQTSRNSGLQTPPILTPHTWLVSRLTVLGVEAAEESANFSLQMT